MFILQIFIEIVGDTFIDITTGINPLITNISQTSKQLKIFFRTIFKRFTTTITKSFKT